MLIKCKSCNAEYNPEGISLPSYGLEFECSECGEKWLELPIPSTKSENYSKNISENEIIEPSVLAGKKSQKFQDLDDKNIPISILAKQEISAQKEIDGINGKSLVDIQMNVAEETRSFDWVVHSDDNKEKVDPLVRKSFELLTNPKSNPSNLYKNDENENKGNSSGLKNSSSIDKDEPINPELIQRIKGTEQNKNSDQDISEQPKKPITSGKKSIFIILSLFILSILIGLGTIWSDNILSIFPSAKPVILFVQKMLILAQSYFYQLF